MRRCDASGSLLSSSTWDNASANGDDSPFELLLGGEDQAWVVGYSQQALSVAGAGVWRQTWSRDPGASLSTSLSNALAYVALPWPIGRPWSD